MNALPGHLPGRAWQESLHVLGQKLLPKKRAILVISAHWQTRGSELFASTEPHMIHDFIGFPKELHAFQYLAPGAVEDAHQLSEALRASGHDVQYTAEWGYDHGVWSVLGHLAPDAGTPVFMLSIDRKKTLEEHLALAVAVGRNLPDDVLVVGSGNIVHALAGMEEDPAATPPPWAISFDEKIADAVVARDWNALTGISRAPGTADKLSVPTLDHFVPLIYAVGIAGKEATASFPHQGFDHATISMRCVLFHNP